MTTLEHKQNKERQNLNKEPVLSNNYVKNNSINIDPNESSLNNSQMLSSITDISSYNSYGDYDEKNLSKTTQNETESGNKSIISVDSRLRKKKNPTSVLEAILKNCRGRSKMKEKICKICLYDKTLKGYGSIITPCKCHGNLKYMHEECLKTYLILRKHNLEETLCETCKAKMRMKIDFQYYFFPKKILKEGLFSFLISIFLTIALSCLLSLLLIFNLYFKLDVSILDLNENLRNRDIFYILAAVIIWLALFFTILISLVFKIRDCCYIKKITEWKIFNYFAGLKEKEEDFDEEEIHQSWFRKWCPLNFFLLTHKSKKEAISNKIQHKNEIFILLKKEEKIQNTLVFNRKSTETNDFKQETPQKNIENILTPHLNNNKMINADIININPQNSAKISAKNLENNDKKKPQGKFNFTFRNETFTTKPIILQEEHKSPSKPVHNLFDNSIPCFNVNVDQNKDYEVPEMKRSFSPLKNTFQKELKKISKEELICDINYFVNGLQKEFLNYDGSNFVHLDILLKIHSYSLEYVREHNKTFEEKVQTQPPPVKNHRTRSTRSQNSINNSNIIKKRLFSLKKKVPEIN